MSEEGPGEGTGLVAYVEAIETHLRVRRGVDHTLSPRDFALAKGWYQAGVSLAVVLVGIDRAFEVEPTVSSLSFCRRRVEELLAAGPRGASPTTPGGERLSSADVAEVLGALRARLSELPPAGFALPIRKIEEVEDLVAVAARPNWDYIRSKLQEIDAEISEAALLALPAAEADEIRSEAARAAEHHQGRVDPAALEDVVRRFVRQRARERLKLPRVNVL